jgi:Cd2+/Zn2+-exporting ATPase
MKGKAIGFISMIDSVRPHAVDVIEELKNGGVKKIVMLTGDNKEVASRIAQEVHITEYKADLLPEDKVNFLKETIKSGYKVAMVGDGVNDAPSLGLADIGIAMGAIGTDAAIESADIVLMKDKLVNVLEMAKLSHRTMKIINQDFWIWGLSNVLGLVLVFAGVLGPSRAAAFNFLTDFLPLFNSLRLFHPLQFSKHMI